MGARALSSAVLALSGVLLLWKCLDLTTRRKVRHPPSPRSLPLLGNLFSIPAGVEHIAFTKLGEQLNSDIVFLKLFGHSFVILNSAQAAFDLLEKRSALYSDRYCPPILKDPNLLDWSEAPSLLGYNDLWRYHRRVMNNWLNARASTQFHKLQEHQARRLLERLLGPSTLPTPFEKVKRESFFATASSIFQLVYGYDLKGDQDPFLQAAQRVVEHANEAIMFSNFFVNIFPALSYVPEWFPGTRWKQKVREWRADKEQAMNELFEWTKAQVAAGVAEPSIIGALLQDHHLTLELSIEERDRRLKNLAILLYMAGIETSANVIIKFIAAMVLNPEVQAKAQHEIDTVLGPDALPTMSDRERLPYLNNLILELLRYYPVAPTGVPHACFQDDIYRGYDIQQGTIVIGNLWAMSRNEGAYKDPEVFNPDRFLDPSVPPLPVFGWGRRKCPGVYFAEASLFIVISSLFAVFRFSKKKDANGNEIVPKIEDASNTIILGLKPFDFEFQPRSEAHRRLVLESH